MRFLLPRPMHGRPEADFSLSGLKTALRLEAEKIAPLTDQDVADLCASFQQAVVETVMDRLRAGLQIFRERYGAPTALVAAGGVAANQAIRKVLHRIGFESGTVLVAPPPALCTDNGAMIAWAGAERLALGLTDSLDTAPRARWPLDEVSKPAAAESFFGRAQPAAARRPSHEFRPLRGARRRRLGQRARQRSGARGPPGDAVGARSGKSPRQSPRRRESPRLPGMKLADGVAVTRRSGASRRQRQCHSAGGAGAGAARGRDRAERRRRRRARR